MYRAHEAKRGIGAVAALVVALIVASAAGVATGCRPFYIAKVGVQHLRYVSRARPISEEIERTSDATRRRRLELVLAARDWAAGNGLEPGGSYLEISDTDGLATGYVVTAAYRDRLEPYEWKYPVVGKIPYRGYFELESAQGFAEGLAADGYDTYVFAAAGFSTLGWMNDPLPSSLLAFDDVEIVDVVLHEIVHQTVYVKNEIEFNETLASAVAKKLTHEFFDSRDEASLAAEAARRRKLWLEQSALFDEFAARLRGYFEASRETTRDARLAGRAPIYAELAEQLRALELQVATLGAAGEAAVEAAAAGAVAAAAPDLNNAVFLALYRYRKRAGVIDDYLETFDSMSVAMADLRERSEAADGDPYAALAQQSRAGKCCSRTTAVSFLASEPRPAAGRTLLGDEDRS